MKQQDVLPEITKFTNCNNYVSSKYKWQTLISQSACADDTHHSLSCHFYQKIQKHLLSVNFSSPKGPSWQVDQTRVREKIAPHVGTATLSQTLCQWAEHSLSPGDTIINSDYAAINYIQTLKVLHQQKTHFAYHRKPIKTANLFWGPPFGSCICRTWGTGHGRKRGLGKWACWTQIAALGTTVWSLPSSVHLYPIPYPNAAKNAANMAHKYGK